MATAKTLMRRLRANSWRDANYRHMDLACRPVLDTVATLCSHFPPFNVFVPPIDVMFEDHTIAGFVVAFLECPRESRPRVEACLQELKRIGLIVDLVTPEGTACLGMAGSIPATRPLDDPAMQPVEERAEDPALRVIMGGLVDGHR